MLNTLGVRSAIGSRRKLSFRNVSNVVMQLLHTIKFSEPVPFSNIATGSFPSAASALGGGVGGGVGPRWGRGTGKHLRGERWQCSGVREGIRAR
ncbi:hypothetical protein M5D96_011606 [Drosophila gunungcola]|uniref:Uncharacterized protein n=1 Tax=Drosophila gunungcola TaxID=103775 RepID=A0A9Q0BKI5_9MUSC|nr:hypothetical protein M5D96_011606 [Drosophila gunungcola]